MSDTMPQQCSRCYIYRPINNFDYRPNGVRYVTCNTCRTAFAAVAVNSDVDAGRQTRSRTLLNSLLQPTPGIRYRAPRRRRTILGEIDPNTVQGLRRRREDDSCDTAPPARRRRRTATIAGTNSNPVLILS